MNKLRRPLLIAGVLLLALFVWRVSTRPGPPADVVPPPTGDEGTAEALHTRLEGTASPRTTAEPGTPSKPQFTLDAHGIVVDEAKHPQVGVEVVAIAQSSKINWGTGAARALRAFRRPVRHRPRVAARTTTDDEGRFRLEGLAGDRTHHIQARPEPPFGWVNAQFRSTYHPQREIELVVKRGSTLRVRVVDGDGRGTRAWIDVWAGGRGTVVADARTDDGAFETPVVPDGLVTILARVPGVASVSRGVVAPHPGEIVLALEGGGDASVIGTVRDEAGAPLADVEVVVSVHREAGGLQRLTRTDAGGSYRFDHLPAGTLGSVIASAPDRLLARFGGGNRALEESTEITADLVLHPGHTIRGRVVDEEGLPVPDVRVYAATGDYPPKHAHEDITDAQGRFEVGPFPAGLVQLGTQKAGWYQPAGTSNDIERDRPRHRDIQVDGAEEVEVVLLRGLSIPGRCVDPEGQGVAGLLVTALPDWRALGGLYPLWSTAARVVRTDAGGAFVFEGLAPGLPWQLQAKGAGHEGKTGMLGPWTRGATIPPVILEVLGTAKAQGRVIDPDGKGVPGVTVRASGSQRSRSGAEGAFEISGIAPGRVRLSVSGPQGRALGRVDVDDVRPGEVRGGIEIRVPRSTHLTGTLLSSTGEPAANTTVVFAGLTEGRFRSQARTDETGRFTVRLWGDGPFQPSVEGRPLARHVRAGEDDVQLVAAPPLPDLQVRIVDPRGDPVPKVRVGVRAVSSSNVNFEHDVDGGLLRLSGPQRLPGTGLIVTGPRDASGAPLNLVPREVVLGDEGDELVVRLEDGAALRGVVVDSSGAPVSGIRVQATSRGTRGVGRPPPRGSVLTDETGRFSVPGLPRAPAALSTLPEDPWLPSPVVEVDGVGQDATLQVRRGVPFVVTVTDGERRPLPGITVSVRGRWEDRAWNRTGPTDESGRVAFAGVAPGGGYTVKARAQGAGARRYPNVELEDVSYGSGALSIVMAVGLMIEGEVVDPDGNPVRKGRIVASTASGRRSTTTRLEGTSNRFSLGPLEAGTYRVQAGPSGRWRESVTVEVEAPARGVRLVLTRATTLKGQVLNVDGREVDLQWTDHTFIDGGVLPEDGRFSLEVRDVRGTLYASDRPRTVCALVENVRASDGPFELRLVPAAAITGKIGGWPPEGDEPWVVAALGPLRLFCEIEEDGTFTLKGLPPGSGPWHLELRTEYQVLGTRDGVAAGATHVQLALPPSAD